MGSSKKIIFVTFLVSFYMFSSVSSTEFEVGGEDGWIVPKTKTHGDMFNKWASENRFKVGDTIRKYFFYSLCMQILSMTFITRFLILVKVSSTRKTRC